MDNISHRLSTEDTATSMYLSFDESESTMSTACYKTLEAETSWTDVSALSTIDVNESVNKNKTKDNHMNSTLEAHDDSQPSSPLKTVKKIDMPDMKLHTPLRALPKNILKEYKALCSTPSREQLLKTVDVTRGSEATRCVDLGLAFLGVDDEKPAYFAPPPAELCEENKENALPETEEVSTLSTCSSVEITTSSVIERKMLTSVSTVGSITEEESVEEVNIMENVEDILDSADELVDKNLASYNSLLLDEANNALEVGKEATNMVQFTIQNTETTPKAKVVNIEHMDTITESLENPDEKTPVVKELEITKKNIKKSSSKPKIAVLSRNARRSICEPNLQANKPSRILNSENKRQSLLPISRKSTMPMDAETEIPLLMSKLLKITNTPAKAAEADVKKPLNIVKEQNKSTTAEKMRSIMASIKTRTSLLPSTAGEKRPFRFTQRMSVVVKTTLNSPARKIARKSSMGGVTTSLQRRSVISQKTTTADVSNIKKPEAISRKSMLPTEISTVTKTKAITKTLLPLQETLAKPTTTTQRKSIYPSEKVVQKPVISQTKTDVVYTCNICKEKFRIKYLLDAHKRSHENNNETPTFIKKPMTTLSSSSSNVAGNSNQCKYCDKKFALTRALHIHLLQNCSKIPPSEKRKLQYTDLNHVEKAQLPNVFAHHHNLQSNASSTVVSTNAAPRHALKQNINILTLSKSSTESSNENKHIQKFTKDLMTSDGNKMAIFQGPVQKNKKISAHAGVYRTPSKSVPCHLCKLTFKSILDFTNHNLEVHGSNKTIITEDTGNDIVVKGKVTTTNANN